MLKPEAFYYLFHDAVYSTLKLIYIFRCRFPTFAGLSAAPLSDSPRPQGQRLQLQRGGLDVAPERYDANNHTHNIHNIVPISLDIAVSTTLYTSVFFRS